MAAYLAAVADLGEEIFDVSFDTVVAVVAIDEQEVDTAWTEMAVDVAGVLFETNPSFLFLLRRFSG